MQASIEIINYWQQSYIDRYGESTDVFCQQAATKEEEKVKNSLHQPPNIRVGEKISVSEIFIPGRQRRDCSPARTVQCPGKIGWAMVVIITLDGWCFMMLVGWMEVGVRQKCCSCEAAPVLVYLLFSHNYLVNLNTGLNNTMLDNPVQHYCPTQLQTYLNFSHLEVVLIVITASQPIINISKWNSLLSRCLTDMMTLPTLNFVLNKSPEKILTICSYYTNCSCTAYKYL